MADGVKPADLYPLELDVAAIAKLDTIKDDIVWWESGAQSQELIGSGEVAMSMIWNGRGYSAKHTDNKPVEMQWNQQILTADYFVVPEGHAEQAGRDGVHRLGHVRQQQRRGLQQDPVRPDEQELEGQRSGRRGPRGHQRRREHRRTSTTRISSTTSTRSTRRSRPGSRSEAERRRGRPADAVHADRSSDERAAPRRPARQPLGRAGDPGPRVPARLLPRAAA